jgi:hypothetical protein
MYTKILYLQTAHHCILYVPVASISNTRHVLRLTRGFMMTTVEICEPEACIIYDDDDVISESFTIPDPALVTNPNRRASTHAHAHAHTQINTRRGVLHKFIT